MAILRHIANKRPDLELYGHDEVSRSNCAMIEFELSDAKSRMTGLMYRTGRDGEGQSYLAEELPHQLSLFESFLGDKTWFAGDRMTVCDFLMREYLDCAVLFSGNSELLGGNYARLASFKSRFDTIPSISAYLVSEKFEAVRGINNQHAKFR